jgi:hypothetical protein
LGALGERLLHTFESSARRGVGLNALFNGGTALSGGDRPCGPAIARMGTHADFDALADRKFIRKISEMVVADFPAGPVNWDGEHVHPHVFFLDLNLHRVDVSARIGSGPIDFHLLATHVSCQRCRHLHGRGTAARAGCALLFTLGLPVGRKALSLVVIAPLAIHRSIDWNINNPSLLAELFLGHERNLLLRLNGTRCEQY